MAYQFNPNDEYLFYPAPLSREASFENLMKPPAEVKITKDVPKIYDPNIRKQITKLKPKYPWFLGLVSCVQILSLAYSFFLNWRMTGAVINTNMAEFNYMIGPDVGVLINMGARHIPCMKSTLYATTGAYFQCPLGITGSGPYQLCKLSDICSLGGMIDGTQTSQSWRFFAPILLHAGVVHLILNLSTQVQAGFQLEKDMGWWRMALVYTISGAGGFLYAACMSDVTVPSVGASGSLYGNFHLFRVNCLSIPRFVSKLDVD
ncbi:hypothetical protein HDV06_002467 [Boothiomyces sp. JEL0866]|nr:hypothetical protein HDV06_002467 [Boothiomyces sp. JEL0866]